MSGAVRNRFQRPALPGLAGIGQLAVQAPLETRTPTGHVEHVSVRTGPGILPGLRQRGSMQPPFGAALWRRTTPRGGGIIQILCQGSRFCLSTRSAHLRGIAQHERKTLSAAEYAATTPRRNMATHP